ncbi:MFS transporter, partial [Aureobasidium melanogenum]
MELPKIHNPLFIAVVATLGGMLFGFDISSMSAIILTDQYRDFFDNPSGVRQGAIGSSLAAGSVFGSAIAGPFSDWIGRRNSIFYSCFFWIAGTVLQTATNGFGMLVAGRVLNGITVGITSSQVPVYLAEIARKEKRGSLIIIQQLAIEVGILVMYFLGYGCTFIPGPASFRTAWSMQFVPCFFLMVGLPFLPESPRWLAKVDRSEEAIQTLADIQAEGDVDDPTVVAEWEDITTTLAAERSALPGWRKFIYNGMWKRTVAGFCVQMWQQNSGANVMTYYVVYIFGMAGLSNNVNLISSGVQYAIFIIGTAIMFFYVDKVGRRPLLIYGAIAMGVCHFVVGGVLSTGTYDPDGVDGNPNIKILVGGSAGNTVIAFCYLLILIYSMSLAPVCWIYAAEVWSLETRATGMGIAAIGNWLFNFALGMYIPPGFQNITWRMFIIFGVMCFLGAAQFFLTFPETSGKTLEEVELLFSGEIKPWKTKPGHSKLDEMINEARDNHLTISEKHKLGHNEHVEVVGDEKV